MLNNKINLNQYISDLKLSKKRVLTTLFIFLIFIWVLYTLNNAIDYNKIDESDVKTNHFMDDFVIEQTDKNGEIKWILNGERLEKFPNSLRSEVLYPSMQAMSGGGSSWKVTATHALDPDSEFTNIYLTNNVKFKKESSTQEEEVVITTTRAIIYPEEDRVETDAFATIVTPDSKTTGDGVIANIKEGYVKILANAKRIAVTDKRSERLEGDQLLYDLNKKTWAVVMKKNKNEKEQVKERVKTILKTRKKGTD